MLTKALTLERGNLAAGLLFAAMLAIPNGGTGPVPMIAYVPPGTAVNIMAPKPKPKATWHDSVGPLPADNWDNDLPYNPDVDVTPYADLEKALDAELGKKPKRKD
jgi:hypothetical protein